MTEPIAAVLLALVGLWVLIGGVVAAIAIPGGRLARVDPAARGAPVLFRVLILPGVVGLWPVVIARLRAGDREAPPPPRSMRPLRRAHGWAWAAAALALAVVIALGLWRVSRAAAAVGAAP